MGSNSKGKESDEALFVAISLLDMSEVFARLSMSSCATSAKS